MNKWDLLLPATKRLLIALILLKHNQYVPKLISHLNVLLYHQKMDSKIWKMHVDDPACFNEEPGELSFAALGRAKGPDATTDIFTHLNNLYPLVNCCIDHHDRVEVDEEFKSTTGRKQSQRFRVQRDSVDTFAVITFFMTAIREMRSNIFRIYDGTEASYKDKNHANQNKKVAAASLIWRSEHDFIQTLKEYIKKTKKQIIGCNIIGRTDGISWEDVQFEEDHIQAFDQPVQFMDPDEYVRMLLNRSSSMSSRQSSEMNDNLSQTSSVISRNMSIVSQVSNSQHSRNTLEEPQPDDFEIDHLLDVDYMHSGIPDPYEGGTSDSDDPDNESKSHQSKSSSSSAPSRPSIVHDNVQHDLQSQVSRKSVGIPEIIVEQKLNVKRLKMYRIKWQNEPIKDSSWEYAENFDKWDDYKYLVQDWRDNMGPKIPGTNRYKRKKVK